MRFYRQLGYALHLKKYFIDVAKFLMGKIQDTGICLFPASGCFLQNRICRLDLQTIHYPLMNSIYRIGDTYKVLYTELKTFYVEITSQSFGIIKEKFDLKKEHLHVQHIFSYMQETQKIVLKARFMLKISYKNNFSMTSLGELQKKFVISQFVQKMLNLQPDARSPAHRMMQLRLWKEKR